MNDSLKEVLRKNLLQLWYDKPRWYIQLLRMFEMLGPVDDESQRLLSSRPDMVDLGIGRVTPLMRLVMKELRVAGELPGANRRDLSLLQYLELHLGRLGRENDCDDDRIPQVGRPIAMTLNRHSLSEAAIAEVVRNYYVLFGYRPQDGALFNPSTKKCLTVVVSELGDTVQVTVTANYQPGVSATD